MRTNPRETIKKGLGNLGSNMMDMVDPLMAAASKMPRNKLPVFSDAAKKTLKTNRTALRESSDTEVAAFMDKVCEEGVKELILSENAIKVVRKMRMSSKDPEAIDMTRNAAGAHKNGVISFVSRVSVSTDRIAKAWETPSKMPWCNAFSKMATSRSKEQIKEMQKVMNKSLEGTGVTMEVVKEKGLFEAMLEKDTIMSAKEKGEMRTEMKTMVDCLDKISRKETGLSKECKEVDKIVKEAMKETGIPREAVIAGLRVMT